MDVLRRGERGKDVDEEGGAHGMGRAAWLLHDATTAQLLQDAFASDALQFAVLQVGICLAAAAADMGLSACLSPVCLACVAKLTKLRLPWQGSGRQALACNNLLLQHTVAS